MSDKNDNVSSTQSAFSSAIQQFLYQSEPLRPGAATERRLSPRKRKPKETAFETSSPEKKKARSSSYADPAVYAHLPVLKDVLDSNLICVFVGTNPGIKTSTSGHAYAHPSNLFWKLLHYSGCTDRRCRPEEDVDLPRLYAMGNTNLVERPTKNAAELSKTEMVQGTPVLEAKIRRHRPEAVCIVGKGIWEAIWRYRHGDPITKDQFKYGWQDEEENFGPAQNWKGARVFVATSTSGLSANTLPHEKEAIWKPFGQWVRQRRQQREEQVISRV